MTGAQSMLSRLKIVWILLAESISSFRRNGDLGLASSLAFYSALALIPALFLITFITGNILGSSHKAILRIQEMVINFIPQYSKEILKEVRHLTSLKTGIGALNIFILIWSIMPLAGQLRTSLNTIFMKDTRKPLPVEKLLDIVIITAFIAGLSLVALENLIIKSIKLFIPFFTVPAYLKGIIPFILITLLTLFLYQAFTMIRLRYLLLGALTTTILWFIMKPAFTLFLTFNPGYGVVFGSFKSLFIVMIWIYYSQIAFLFGAEVSANLLKMDVIIMKRVIKKNKSISKRHRFRMIRNFKKGEVIFNEGDVSKEFYYLIKGKVGILKGGREIASVGEKEFIGEMAFLTDEPRTATAICLEDTELLVIDHEKLDILIKEIPDLFRMMLRDMACRLKKVNDTL